MNQYMKMRGIVDAALELDQRLDALADPEWGLNFSPGPELNALIDGFKDLRRQIVEYQPAKTHNMNQHLERLRSADDLHVRTPRRS